MPTGVLINVACVFLGGLAGAWGGKWIPERIRQNLPVIFGMCAISMGICNIVKMSSLPAVVLAVIVGYIAGELFKLDAGVRLCARKVVVAVERRHPPKQTRTDLDQYLGELVGIAVLFCVSGTGIYGALLSGMSGDHSVLIAKSFLDLFTAIIFASSLGAVVALISVPQAVILLGLFFGASLLLPLMSEAMLADFSACGGVVLLITGFSMSGIKVLPLANLIPAMVLVVPFSYAWTCLLG